MHKNFRNSKFFPEQNFGYPGATWPSDKVPAAAGQEKGTAMKGAFEGVLRSSSTTLV